MTPAVQGSVVTLGNFDGVHLGHQELIRAAQARARAMQLPLVVLTFKPHPHAVLRPESAPPLLLTYEEKVEALHQLGVDHVTEQAFSREFSTLSAEQFFQEYVLKRFSARAVVVGYDFGFGQDREGSLETLRTLCASAGVSLEIVPPFRVDGEIVSSTAVRRKLMEGKMRDAQALLGRPFFYRGNVIRGNARGRTIGFPTANLKLEQKLVLPYGVYATRTTVDGKVYPSVTNVGVRPTFVDAGDLTALVETYLIDQNMDLYGKVLEVEFVERIRAERKFGSIDELKSQIARDVEAARVLTAAVS